MEKVKVKILREVLLDMSPKVDGVEWYFKNKL